MKEQDNKKIPSTDTEIDLEKDGDKVVGGTELPWGELGVDVVLECTGFYTSKEKALEHVEAGTKNGVISAPAGNDFPI